MKIDPVDAEFMKDPLLKRGMFVSRLVLKHGFAPVLLTAVLSALGYGAWWSIQQYAASQKELITAISHNIASPKIDISAELKRRGYQDEAIRRILADAQKSIGDAISVRLIQTHDGIRSFSGYIFLYISTTHELGNCGISLGTQKIPTQAVQATFDVMNRSTYLILDSQTVEHINYQRLIMPYGVRSSILVKMMVINQSVLSGWLEADFDNDIPNIAAVKFLAIASKQIGAVLYDKQLKTEN